MTKYIVTVIDEENTLYYIGANRGIWEGVLENYFSAI